MFAGERGSPLSLRREPRRGARATHEDDDQHCEPAGYAPREKSRDEVARRGRLAHRGRASYRHDLLGLVGRAAEHAVILTTAEAVCPVREHTWISAIARVDDDCRPGERATWREGGGASDARVDGRAGAARAGIFTHLVTRTRPRKYALNPCSKCRDDTSTRVLGSEGEVRRTTERTGGRFGSFTTNG